MSVAPVPTNGNGVGIRELFDRLLRVTTRSVRVQARLVAVSTANGEKLDKLAEVLADHGKETAAGRDRAVDEVKKHVGEVVAAKLAESTRWERRFLIIIGILIIISNLVGGSPTMRTVLDGLFRGPK